MGNGPKVKISSLEWEDFVDSWKIDSLESSEFLPPGAERIEVWREENYDLKAKIVGSVAPQDHLLQLHPEEEPGSAVALFELKGSGTHDILNYELGSCAIGPVLSSEWRDKEADPPVITYEAELITSAARLENRYRDPFETEWLTEWYLNAPQDQYILYDRSSLTKLEGRYVRRRNLPINQEESFEASTVVSGTRLAFVETSKLNFLIQQVPKEFRPPWSECLAIEYRPKWGEVPSVEDRKSIAALVGFLMGRELINIGYTRFDKAGYPMEKVALHPRKDNLIALCQQSSSLKPTETNTLRNEGGIAAVLKHLLPNYLALKNDLRLDEALECYWLAKEIPIGYNLPILQAGVETLSDSWFDSTKSPTGGDYIAKEDFMTLLGSELKAAEAKLQNYKYKKKILDRLYRAYEIGVNDRLRFFFEEIGLPVSQKEWRAINKRHPMAHGASSVFDSSANDDMLKATYVYETLFHRILLKVLDYQGAYIDYGTLGYPKRPIDQPSGAG
jgi:hypothetical protein